MIFFGAFESNEIYVKEKKFTQEEVMIISLTYMAHGIPYLLMQMTYGHDWTRYCYMVEWFAISLYHKFYHRISRKSLEYWTTYYNINDLREKIFNYVCFDIEGECIEELEDIELEKFIIFAWKDCMMCITSRPDGSNK